jgi:hypothetical protein
MIIKKGTHAPFRLPKLLFKPESLRYEVEFTESCRYRFGTEDDADVNKLFGIAFITWGSFWFVLKNLLRGKVKALHHYNSIRWGWRYDALSGRIELISYLYGNGKRIIEYHSSVSINEKLTLNIYQPNAFYYRPFLLVNEKYNKHSAFTYHRYLLGYELHPYFGGNRTAPHDMEIKIKRL